MAKAPLVEIFNSYQGEGIYLGRPMTFVRLGGCNLNCNYCDTRYARDSAKFLWISSRQLSERIKKFPGQNIISFTGGEPLLYPDFLQEVFHEIKKLKKKIYLETNGTLPQNFQKVKKWVEIIALDIKLPSATGKDLFDSARHFLQVSLGKKVFGKIVLTEKTRFSEIKKAVEIISGISPEIKLCFTPASQGRGKFFTDRAKIDKFVSYARQFLSDVRVIPQIHKIFGWK